MVYSRSTRSMVVAYLKAQSIIAGVQVIIFFLSYEIAKLLSATWMSVCIAVLGMVVSIALSILLPWLWRRSVGFKALCILLLLTNSTVFFASHIILTPFLSLDTAQKSDRLVVSDVDIGSRVYIEEDGVSVSFIVITNNHDGSCLLLREYLLDDCVPYNDSGEYGSYYSHSVVDDFLNEGYLSRLSDGLQDIIVKSNVEITSKNAMDTHGNVVDVVRRRIFRLSKIGTIKNDIDEQDGDIEVIRRKVFLLSASEIGVSLSHIALQEGEPLPYFKDNDTRVASYNDSEGDSWLLRTSALRDGNTVFCVAGDGVVEMVGVSSVTGYNNCGVRPAFCIPSGTPVIVDGNGEFHIE